MSGRPTGVDEVRRLGPRVRPRPREFDRGPAQGGLGDQVRRCAPRPRGSGVRLQAPFVLLALGIDEALRHSDPYDPHFGPANVDNILKWGMDCPDAAYTGAAVRGDATYKVTGNRRTVRYLGFQVMSGIESTANVIADELPLAPDGSFELPLLSCDEPDDLGDATWMPLTDSTSSLVVRQFFYDWANESPADLHIECLARSKARSDHAGPSAAGVANQFAALGEFVDASFRFWQEVEDGGRAQGLNIFREPAALTNIGAAAENVSVWGSWQLEDDEALLIEVAPPTALVLECRPRQPLVGDHRLRQPPVEPQRVPGCTRRRQRLPCRCVRATQGLPTGWTTQGTGRAR